MTRVKQTLLQLFHLEGLVHLFTVHVHLIKRLVSDHFDFMLQTNSSIYLVVIGVEGVQPVAESHHLTARVEKRWEQFQETFLEKVLKIFQFGLKCVASIILSSGL